MTDTTAGEGVQAMARTLYKADEDHGPIRMNLNFDQLRWHEKMRYEHMARTVISAGGLAAQTSAGAQGEAWGSLVRVVDAKGFTTLHEPDEEGKAGDLVASIWNEDYLPVAWGCATCNSPRSVDPCPKCGTALTKPADGWEWPGLPDIDRIRGLAREVGYGVGVHGSQERDFDLIAAPWVDEAVSPLELARHIAAGLGGTVVDYVNQGKPHARWSCNIQTPNWTKLIDLSVMPPATPALAAQGEAVGWMWRAGDGMLKLTTWRPDTVDAAPLYATPAQPDTGDVAALREALEECQRVFADYAEMHRHKLTHMLTEHQRKDIHRKIERNRDMSDMCLAALSKPNAPGRE